MMKWGARKTSSASPSNSAFSWLSKLKQMRINSEPSHGKTKHEKETKQNSTSVGSTKQNSCGSGDGDDALWKPSFGEEEIHHEDKKSGGRDAKKQYGTRESTLKKFKEEKKKKNCVQEKERKLEDDRNKVSLENMDDYYNREKEYELLRRRFERKAQSVLQEQLLKLEREAAKVEEFASMEKGVLQFDSPRTICTPRTHSFASFADSKKKVIEMQNLKLNEELKVKTKKKRQARDDAVSREIQRRKPKVRINSPRMKVLEDMKKSKLMKMKKTERNDHEEVVVEESSSAQGSSSDSFAVIKCSLDPKQDFRDSMVEMIVEKGIRDPDEMEELLAMYLTLNADEYHDLIIKVFRQVWFDMNQGGGGLGIKSNTLQCCYCE